jgi:hypothetical protein
VRQEKSPPPPFFWPSSCSPTLPSLWTGSCADGSVPGDMLGGRGIGIRFRQPRDLQILWGTPPAKVGGGVAMGEGTMHPEPHSTFVLNSKEFLVSPTMSHCKKTPRIRMTASLSTTRFTPSVAAAVNVVQEKGCVCHPREFPD